MYERMRAVVVRPGEPAVAQEIDGSLEGMQRIVNGMIQCIYPYEDNVGLLCNDEGKLLGMEANRALRDENGEVYDVISGPFVVVGLSSDNFQSLTPEQEQQYIEMYKTPERFERRNGRITVIPMKDMMDFKLFQEEVIKALQERLAGDGIHTDIIPTAVDKIQESYNGISIKVKNDPVGLTINMDAAFEHYRHAGSLTEVTDQMYDAINSGLEKQSLLSVDNLSDYSWVRERLTVEVINREGNADFLSKVPHGELADLGIIYRVRISDMADGAATVVVTDNMVRAWKVSEEQLKADAMVNAENKYPIRITSMQNIIGDLMGQASSDPDMPLLVCMAGNLPTYGAGVIAYDNFADEIGKTLPGDFYILPSSRHEVILIPAQGVNPAALEEMVRSINASDVMRAKDVLSDHVYRYDAAQKTIGLVTDFEVRKQEMQKGVSVNVKVR